MHFLYIHVYASNLKW